VRTVDAQLQLDEVEPLCIPRGRDSEEEERRRRRRRRRRISTEKKCIVQRGREGEREMDGHRAEGQRHLNPKPCC
jgi:hypothetical protein